MESKVCKTKRENFSACGLTKPIDDFYKGSSLCKECFKLLGKTRSEYHKEYSKKHYSDNKEYYHQNGVEYRETNKENTTFESLGYSPLEFRDFMEKLNPNWRDFEIDHKIPLSWFKNDTPPNIPNDFRNLHLKNKSENSSKKNYYMDDVSEDYWGVVKEYLKEDIVVKYNL